MFSARLAKIINLLIMALTTCLCNAGKHVAKSGEIRQSTSNRDIIAEVRGNYSNFTQKLAEKEHFVIWRVSKKQPLFGKCVLRAALSQRLRIRTLSKDLRPRKQKTFQKSRVFSVSFIKKGSKKVLVQPKVQRKTAKMLENIRRHEQGAISSGW